MGFTDGSYNIINMISCERQIKITSKAKESIRF